MLKIFVSLLFLLSAEFLFYSCIKPSPTSSEPKGPAPEVAAVVSKASWQQKWDSVLAAAKKEGKVSAYAIWRPDTRVALTKAFKEKYGISLEMTPFSRGTEVLPRVKAEKRAGLYLADVFGVGNSDFILLMKPDELLGSIKPLLILPEVLEAKAWQGGEIPFTDKEGTALSMLGIVQPIIVYNTNLVKDGEIASAKDLLKPQYRGKITLNDPTATGPGSSALAHILHSFWNEEEMTDFLRRLLTDQKVEIQRDHRIQLESVAQGKYAIALSTLPDLTGQLIAAGAPIKVAEIKEGRQLTSAAGVLGVPGQFAHPNAAIVFVNWLLSREGQTIFAQSWGQASMRLDASREGINPVFIPRPGEKYYPTTEEFLKTQGRMLDIAKKLVAELVR